MTEKRKKYLETIAIVKEQLKKNGYQINDNYAKKNLDNGWIMHVSLAKNENQNSKVSAKNISYNNHLDCIDLFKDSEIKCTPSYIRNETAYKVPTYTANGWADLLQMRIEEKLSK